MNNIEIQNLIVTPTWEKGYFKLNEKISQLTGKKCRSRFD